MVTKSKSNSKTSDWISFLKKKNSKVVIKKSLENKNPKKQLDKNVNKLFSTFKKISSKKKKL